jgi:hypothetical protein
MLKSRDSKSKGGDTGRAMDVDEVALDVAVVELLADRRRTCRYEL